MRKVIVVKVSGYYVLNEAFLRNIVKAINKAKVTPIFVCGGGIFANTVREAYLNYGVDEKTAHYAAIKAMEVSAIMFSRKIPKRVFAETLEEINSAIIRGTIPIVLPYRIVSKVNILPESWEITSDSIAALISLLSGVRKIVFVKKAPSLKGFDKDVCKYVDKYACKIIKNYGLSSLVVNGDRVESIVLGFISV